MKIEQTVEPKDGKNFRIFTINLDPKETRKIPDDSFITPYTESGVQFYLFGRGSIASVEKPAFRPMPEPEDAYYMYTKGGFKSDEEQLEYLVSLSDIPMMIPGTGSNEIPFGYVRFQKAS